MLYHSLLLVQSNHLAVSNNETTCKKSFISDKNFILYRKMRHLTDKFAKEIKQKNENDSRI